MPSSSPLRIVFMGTPAFALPTLAKIQASPHALLALYTQPPRPAGRGKKLRPSPTQAWARQHHIPVHTPISLKHPEAVQTLATLKPDVIVVAAYGLLLPQAVLDIPPHGCLNIHPSLLPRWRGAAPIAHTLLAGDQETGVGIMQMEVGLDCGPILAQIHHPIGPEENAGTLHDTLAKKGASLLLQILDAIAAGNPPAATPQSNQGITYATKITAKDRPIDWQQPAEQITHHIRALAPAPGATCHMQGEQVKLLRAKALLQPHTSAPGTILSIHPLQIACGKGILEPQLLQRPGKKPMETHDCLRGFALETGSMCT